MGGVSMEWKEVTLGDLCEISSSKRIFAKEYQSDGVPFYRGKEIIAKQKGNAISNELFISRNQYEEIKARYGVPQQQELLLTSVGTLGVPYVIKEEEFYFKDGNLTWFRHFNGLDVEYLYYWFLSPYGKNEINTKAIGSTQKALTIDSLSKFDIKIPANLDDQRRIASILSSLDRKIELNNKINADLEEMAQAIFKNWFVDFEPFKDGKFVDSELGMIPEGWKVVVFDNILKVTTTKTGKEGIPEYSVTNTGIHPRDEKFTKNLSKSSAKNKLIRKGNLVFGMSREILNWGIMKEEVGGVSSAYNVYIVDEKIVNTTYLECFIAQRMDYFADLIKPASREGQGVDKALLMKKIICIPPSEVMDVFLEKYNSIKLLTEIRNQESSRLSLLRDTLLPRLMSGELEVPE